MKTANLKEALKPFFDKLEVNNLDFNFDEETSSFISTDTFGYEDYELEHYMVIKVINNAGTILLVLQMALSSSRLIHLVR